MAPRVSVFVPALFGPLAGSDPRFLETPRLEALERWWCFGRSQSVSMPACSSAEAVFLELFGISAEAGELPGAQLSLLGQGLDPPDGFCWRADPVHAHAGTVDIHIDDQPVQPVRAHEVEAICRDFNSDFGERGWQLQAPEPGLWYLCSDKSLSVTTEPLSRARGRGLNGVMPGGPDGACLRALLNELQMWLFEHPVNQAREREGQPAINSIWPWGSASPGQPSRHWQALWADDVFYRGAGRRAGTELVCGLPADGQALTQAMPGSGAAVVVLDQLLRPAALGDIGQWYETLLMLDRVWMAPLLKALVQRRIAEVTLVAGPSRVFRLRRRDLWRVWRRRRTLQSLLLVDSGS